MSADICVLMVVQNAMPYLQGAVESILHQTHRDFEFLIIDDHSTDATRQFLATVQDRRLRVLDSPYTGQTRGLNYGLGLTKASWIARMDGDDWAEPHRLERQWALARQHPEAVFVSADYTICDQSLQPVATLSLNVDDPRFRRYVQRRQNPFCHPVMMFRLQAAVEVGLYPEHRFRAQDYALWRSLLNHGPFVHVPESLIKYRLIPSSVSIRDYDQQVRDRATILKREGAPEHRPADAGNERRSSPEGLYAYRMGFTAWIAGHGAECRRWMRRALGSRTRVPQALAAYLLSFLPRGVYLRLTGYHHVYR